MTKIISTLNCKTLLSVTYLLVIVVALLGFMPGAFASGLKERVLYAFQDGTDGSWPVGGVLFSGGKFYGATTHGGAANCQPIGACGTVFELSPHPDGTWTETVLYVFKGKAFNDGAAPSGGLVPDSFGNLYGVTAYGGSGSCAVLGIPGGCGIIFKLNRPHTQGAAWTETILYSFQGGSDSYSPRDTLIFDQAGNLYGASEFGGAASTNCDVFYAGCGTVFELSPPTQGHGPWTETVLYAFSSFGDGGEPFKVIADKSGVLYGTTHCGGLVPCIQSSSSCGIVFMLQPSAGPGNGWTESVLYSFANQPDGCSPAAGVILDKSGNLYGTTQLGGTDYSGTVFELTPPVPPGSTWTETIIDSIHKSQFPSGPLIFDNAGNLYGPDLLSSVFELQHTNQGWAEILLHVFFPAGTSDGFEPTDTLTMDRKGNFYGTTQMGGGSKNCYDGCGTVYEVIP